MRAKAYLEYLLKSKQEVLDSGNIENLVKVCKREGDVGVKVFVFISVIDRNDPVEREK